MIVVMSNAKVVAAEFAGAALGIREPVAAVVRHYAQLLETRVKGRASGRPGPRVVTGDYRRSITHEFQDYQGTYVGRVGTNSAQGRRLEFGFTGTDSLGRYYDQAPLPHFGPALDDTSNEFLEALADASTAGITGIGGG